MYCKLQTSNRFFYINFNLFTSLLLNWNFNRAFPWIYAYITNSFWHIHDLTEQHKSLYKITYYSIQKPYIIYLSKPFSLLITKRIHFEDGSIASLPFWVESTQRVFQRGPCVMATYFKSEGLAGGATWTGNHFGPIRGQ